MVVAFSAATAAIVGAAVGGTIALVADFGLHWWNRRVDRRAAAQVIYAELLTNYGASEVALELGLWPTSSGTVDLTAWHSHGIKLARGLELTQLADVAFAYSRLDDFVYLGRAGGLDDPHDPSLHEALTAIRLGLYELGRMAGWSDRDLRHRAVLDDEVLKLKRECEQLREAGRD